MARRRKTASSGSNGKEDRGRWSSKRKTEIVLRLLRGEDLDAVSRELKVTAARIAQWRDEFLAGGEAAMKSRTPSPQDEENTKLKALIGDLMMRNELLRERARAMEADRPLPWRKSRS